MADLGPRIAELERAIAEHRRFASRVLTQNTISRALAGAGDVDSAIATVLRTICQHFDWALGSLWLVDPKANVLRNAFLHNQAGPEVEPFARSTQVFVFATGTGLPGRCWKARQPIIVPDVRSDENFPRMPELSNTALNGACAFPVPMDGATMGVLEFYSKRPAEQDDALLTAMENIAVQLGQYLVLRRKEQALQLSEAKFRLLVETAPDAIVIIDAQGTVIFANPAVSDLFGWTAAELVGKNMSMLVPPRLRQAHQAGLNRYLSTGKRHINWGGMRLPGVHKNGVELNLNISFGEFRDDGQQIFVGFMRALEPGR